jgi:hypothetical protein
MIHILCKNFFQILHCGTPTGPLPKTCRNTNSSLVSPMVVGELSEVSLRNDMNSITKRNERLHLCQKSYRINNTVLSRGYRTRTPESESQESLSVPFQPPQCKRPSTGTSKRRTPRSISPCLNLSSSLVLTTLSDHVLPESFDCAACESLGHPRSCVLNSSANFPVVQLHDLDEEIVENSPHSAAQNNCNC